MAAMIGVIMMFYGYYLFSLQVVNTTEYQLRARQVARRVLPIPAQRGEIFDRNYDLPLVTNVDSFAVDLVPAELPEENVDRVLSELGSVIEMNPEDILAKLPKSFRSIYQPIEIKSGISYDTIAYLAEQIDRLPGVTWHNKPKRNYVEQGSISHVLGYVGDITREELQILYNKGYDFGSVLGKSGIEKQYDMILRGKDGQRFSTVDVRGRRISEDIQEEDPPTLGKNLVLTIDRKVQQLAERALGDRIGSIVVLKPHTGEVLAMVSYPYFNPEMLTTESDQEQVQALFNDDTYPFLNRAIQSQYAPASTFKVVLTTAILQDNLFPVDKKIVCLGKVRYGDRIFNCHKKTGHGPLSLYEALAESCDIYYWTVGTEHVGIENIIDYARKYGYGELTGIDLPGEVSGLVPTPEWKLRTFKEPWVGGDTMNISIGQGYMGVTPLQMANMVAMVANRGTIYKPHILKEIRDPVTGEVVERVQPEVLLESPVDDETFRKVAEAMRGVITDGTANVVITTKAVDVAGKTGTGEVGLIDQWHSWFAAYGPYNEDDPREKVVVVASIEARNEWEWWAPYATNIIFQGIFADQDFDQAVDALRFRWYYRMRGLQ